MQRKRAIASRLPPPGKRRLVVLTGARQTGKTTLARRVYPELSYHNLDAVEAREAMRAIRTSSWARTAGNAILDEAQKEPSVFDKVKFAFDEHEVDFSVLLGSSRFLILTGVKESLAGRAFVYDLWPLMPVEIRTQDDDTLRPPLLDELLDTEDLDALLRTQPQRLLGDREAAHRASIDHLVRWGGMPELLVLEDADRLEWLRAYQRTFLERDLTDLARIDDLSPFRKLQRLAMLRSGQLLNYSDLGRDAQIAPSTARRYLEYMRVSYQALLLQPYSRNLTSSVVKSPKLYWTDLGTLRQGTGQWGELTGSMFETLVITEIHKWIDTMARDARLYFYRTRSGLEVDLIIQSARGIIGIEVKNRAHAVPSDARSLVSIARATPQWQGGLVVHDGPDLEPLVPRHSIWSMPVTMLL